MESQDDRSMFTGAMVTQMDEFDSETFKKVTYMCGNWGKDCELPIRCGAPKCKQCGYRVLSKKRFVGVLQYEAK